MLIARMVFILLHGPAVIFIPLDFAMLSLEYPWVKIGSKKANAISIKRR
jgi:hypothetical protein